MKIEIDVKNTEELTLPVLDIFNSINGEINLFHQGSFATFIRIAGCNCSCTYCDTKESWDIKNGVELTLKSIVEQVKEIGCGNIMITGGEPLLYKEAVSPLILLLRKSGFSISIETNGTISLEGIIPDCWVVDWKNPREGKFLLNNLDYLTCSDYIKHVICTKEDYQYARKQVILYPEFNHVFSPMLTTNEKENKEVAQQLIDKMKNDGLFHVVFNYQIHKTIGCK